MRILWQLNSHSYSKFVSSRVCHWEESRAGWTSFASTPQSECFFILCFLRVSFYIFCINTSSCAKHSRTPSSIYICSFIYSKWENRYLILTWTYIRIHYSCRFGSFLIRCSQDGRSGDQLASSSWLDGGGGSLENPNPAIPSNSQIWIPTRYTREPMHCKITLISDWQYFICPPMRPNMWALKTCTKQKFFLHRPQLYSFSVLCADRKASTLMCDRRGSPGSS